MTANEIPRDARQKRLVSKAAYRARRSADGAFREAERERVREWRRKCPDKARAQKKKARKKNYHRPFVPVDAEGRDILAGTSSTTACAILGTILICGVQRRMTVGLLPGLWRLRPAASTSALSTQFRS